MSTVEVSEILTDVRGHLSFGPPKTRSSRRTVPVPDFLIDRLKAHLAMRGDLSGDALVFVMPDGSPPRDDNWRRRHWKPAVRRAGLPDNLRFHDLRAYLRGVPDRHGIDQYGVMRHMGHASIKTTYDRYGHRFPGATDEQFRAGMNALAGQANRLRRI